MIYNVNELRKDTVELIKQINMQIAVVEAEATVMDIPASSLRDSHGNWVLSPLLLAKAMAYNTLVTLQTNETKRSPGPGGRRQ